MKKGRMSGGGGGFGGGGGGGIGMWVNLLLLLAMVGANLLSFYHLSTKTKSTQINHPPHLTSTDIPDHLLAQLSTIRSSITHLTNLRPSTTSSSPPATSSELLLYSKISPIATACHHHPDLLHRYMNYTPFKPCPSLSPPDLAEILILHGCHPLPRRRCFSPTTAAVSSRNDGYFPSTLPDSAVVWKSGCKSFSCVHAAGFDMKAEATKFLPQSGQNNLDLSIAQLTKFPGVGPIRLALDVGGGTGTFAARMKLDLNATVLTTTMNLGGLPNNEVAALRGVVPLHVPLQQRFPVHDGVVDLVRCGHAVNRWIPTVTLEFLLYDVDRILRSGGLLWMDHFLCKSSDLDGVYKKIDTCTEDVCNQLAEELEDREELELEDRTTDIDRTVEKRPRTRPLKLKDFTVDWAGR